MPRTKCERAEARSLPPCYGPRVRSGSIFANLPARFHVDEYDRLNRRIAAAKTAGHVAWPQWATAFNGIGYRLVGAARADARLPVAVAKGDRQRQELHLFSFVSSACSAAECFAYATCCAGSMLDPTAFPIDTEAERRKIGIKSVSEMIRIRYTNTEPLHMFLDALLVEPHWRELVDWRDIAIHRGAVPQAHFLGTSGPPTPSTWNVSIHRGSPAALVPAMTRNKLVWLIDQLNDGTTRLHDFLGRQGVPIVP